MKKLRPKLCAAVKQVREPPRKVRTSDGKNGNPTEKVSRPSIFIGCPLGNGRPTGQTSEWRRTSDFADEIRENFLDSLFSPTWVRNWLKTHSIWLQIEKRSTWKFLKISRATTLMFWVFSSEVVYSPKTAKKRTGVTDSIVIRVRLSLEGFGRDLKSFSCKGSPNPS